MRLHSGRFVVNRRRPHRRSRSRAAAARWLLLGLTIVWGVLGGSSRARADAPIRLWHPYRRAEEAALAQILEGWDGPEVVVLAIPYEAFAAKLAAAIPHGEGPDLYIESHERLGDYRRRQIVAPVGDALEPGAFDGRMLATVTLDGEAWAVPINKKSLALYVATDLVSEVRRRTSRASPTWRPASPTGCSHSCTRR